MRAMRLIVGALLVGGLSLAQAPKTAPEKKKADVRSSATAESEVIDINTASEEQLKTIAGVGDAYASKIIAGRPYRAKNELLQKKILPAATYNKIKDRIVARQK